MRQYLKKNTAFRLWFPVLLAIINMSIYVPASAANPNLEGLLVHVTKPISSKMILPKTFPLPGKRSTVIEINATAEEFEPASFVLRPLNQNVTNLSITATDLLGTKKKVISAHNIDIRVVKPWFQSFVAWREIGKIKPNDFRQTLVPELLLKNDSLVTVDVRTKQNFVTIERNNKLHQVLVNPKQLAHSKQALPTSKEFPIKDSRILQPFAIQKDTNKQIWLTFFVPPATVPDAYEGKVEVRSNGNVVKTITVHLNVLAFQLDRPQTRPNVYYRAILEPSKATIGSEARNKEQMRNELQNLYNHGVENPTMYQPFSNEKLLKNALQIRQDLKMNDGPLYFLGLQTTPNSLGHPPRDKLHLRRLLPRIQKIAKEYGFSSVYVYGGDERRGKGLTAQRNLWKVVHELGGKVFVAGYNDAFPKVGDLLDILVHSRHPKSSEAEKWHNAGHKIFLYNKPQTGPENPFLFRLNYGLVLWANNYDSAMPYAYQHCFGSCWNDMDHPKYRDHNFTYPTADGVIDTLAWEGYREAGDDLRYLTTLEYLLINATPKDLPEVIHAQKFLKKLRTEVLTKQEDSGKYNQRMKIKLDVIRKQIITHIQAITSKASVLGKKKHH